MISILSDLVYVGSGPMGGRPVVLSGPMGRWTITTTIWILMTLQGHHGMTPDSNFTVEVELLPVVPGVQYHNESGDYDTVTLKPQSTTLAHTRLQSNPT